MHELQVEVQGVTVKARLIKRRIDRAQAEFDRAALEHPEGCTCQFCGVLLPWDANAIYAHSLRHPEMYEHKQRLPPDQERQVREWRLSQLAELGGDDGASDRQ